MRRRANPSEAGPGRQQGGRLLWLGPPCAPTAAGTERGCCCLQRWRRSVLRPFGAMESIDQKAQVLTCNSAPSHPSTPTDATTERAAATIASDIFPGAPPGGSQQQQQHGTSSGSGSGRSSGRRRGHREDAGLRPAVRIQCPAGASMRVHWPGRGRRGRSGCSRVRIMHAAVMILAYVRVSSAHPHHRFNT